MQEFTQSGWVPLRNSWSRLLSSLFLEMHKNRLLIQELFQASWFGKLLLLKLLYARTYWVVCLIHSIMIVLFSGCVAPVQWCPAIRCVSPHGGLRLPRASSVSGGTRLGATTQCRVFYNLCAAQDWARNSNFSSCAMFACLSAACWSINQAIRTAI